MIGSIAFMDDTQWLTDSKNKLERILKIADSFYTLNDIQVNKDKSELVIRLKKKRKYKFTSNRLEEENENNNRINFKEKINLNFGRDRIEILPKHPSESIHILESGTMQ